MLRSVKCSFCSRLTWSSFSRLTTLHRSHRKWFSVSQVIGRSKSSDADLSTLFVPVPVKPNPDDINVGAELTGNTLNTNDVVRVLNSFYKSADVKVILAENGLDNRLQHQVFLNFRTYCLDVNSIPVDLHIVINDVLQDAGHVTDILPYFMRHAKQMFPHLDCMDDLKKISDLRSPANWYPEARNAGRKLFFHAGPTNSGKTYHALERFLSAESGVYCGPLKLLATEVYRKANDRGTPCDLVTGEERKYAKNAEEPSAHVSCTVEMTSLVNKYDVAVIDEIQMIRDPNRGWAWTRALLGLNAKEIHVCGEEGAIDLIKSMMITTNENCEVFKYKRLTALEVENQAVCDLDNVRDGDCIVCFSKNDVYSVSNGVESRGKEVAVIYGGLPPNTKLAQAQKFNDPNSSCKVLVATDAVGMGLNLSIRRVIFYSLVKPTMNEKGDQEMCVVSVSQALQIAGRAGRYNTQYPTGYVTTFKAEDLPTLKKLLSQTPDPIDRAGIHPTAEQIELYAYHLPHATLSNLMDIFVNLCTVDDSLYFMCTIESFKFVANLTQDIPLPLRARYVFCCAPINRKMPFVCTMLKKYAKRYSSNEPITFTWIAQNVAWPLNVPKNIMELVHLEAVFDVLDLYLWFSYRFPDIFVHPVPVREMQTDLDSKIQQGVLQITRLLKNSERLSATHIEIPDLHITEIEEEEPSQTSNFGKGQLTKKLLSEGLLTPEMLKELQKEWIQKSENNENRKHFFQRGNDNSSPPPRKVKPGKK